MLTLVCTRDEMMKKPRTTRKEPRTTKAMVKVTAKERPNVDGWEAAYRNRSVTSPSTLSKLTPRC